MFTLLVILAIFSQIAIAIGVYLKRHGKHTNTLFMLLSICLALWAFVNYLAITIAQNSHTIYVIRTVLTLVVVQNLLFFLFAKTYPNKDIRQLPRYCRYLTFYSLITAVITQTPIVFSSVKLTHGMANPTPNFGIVFFLIQAGLTIVIGLKSLISKYRHSHNTQHRQLRDIILASIVLWVIVPITNFGFTLAFQTTFFVKFSPFYTLIFAAFITYAIIAQRLFDMHAAIARSVAYVLIICTIVAIYSTLIYGLIDLTLPHAEQSLRNIFSVTLVVLLILGFQPIKRYFDKLTNSIFFKDAYNTQVLVEKLNGILISAINTNSLINEVSLLIKDNLKCNFVLFALLKNDFSDLRVSGSDQHKMNQETIFRLDDLASNNQEVIIEREQIEDTNRALYRLMQENDIGLIAKLTKNSVHSSKIGYLLLGDKRNDSSFTNQDIHFIGLTSGELTIALENALSYERINRFNVTLKDEVSAATRKLINANQELQKLDEAKDDFITMASHQLRTPLTSIIGYSSMLLEGDAKDPLNPTESSFLRIILDSSRRMEFLVSDLLNLSRLKTGKFAIKRDACNLKVIINDLIDQLQEVARDRKVKIVFNNPSEFATYMLDISKTQQIIMNFMDNAIFYSKPGGKMTVNLIDNENQLIFTVKDQGVGVPKNEQHKLFTKFYRAENARKIRPDGTGIGLYIAKKAIIAQGGSLIFSSIENQGSTFGFSFSKSNPQLYPVKQSN